MITQSDAHNQIPAHPRKPVLAAPESRACKSNERGPWVVPGGLKISGLVCGPQAAICGGGVGEVGGRSQICVETAMVARAGFGPPGRNERAFEKRTKIEQSLSEGVAMRPEPG